MNPLSVALQGIGFTAIQVAVHGLLYSASIPASDLPKFSGFHSNMGSFMGRM